MLACLHVVVVVVWQHYGKDPCSEIIFSRVSYILFNQKQLFDCSRQAHQTPLNITVSFMQTRHKWNSTHRKILWFIFPVSPQSRFGGNKSLICGMTERAACSAKWWRTAAAAWREKPHRSADFMTEIQEGAHYCFLWLRENLMFSHRRWCKRHQTPALQVKHTNADWNRWSGALICKKKIEL